LEFSRIDFAVSNCLMAGLVSRKTDEVIYEFFQQRFTPPFSLHDRFFYRGFGSGASGVVVCAWQSYAFCGIV
ncbi:hypothetical protein Q8G39_28475, partial [Klebsiella pneumoniae]|uniref:hypothetical protein n=1 Tax=Klebsiella pneumoniae TaxID=573 RepID=UPI0030138CA7